MDTTITLNEDTMIALANMFITIKENEQSLKDAQDFEGACTIWECLQPGMDALQELIPQFNL